MVKRVSIILEKYLRNIRVDKHNIILLLESNFNILFRTISNTQIMVNIEVNEVISKDVKCSRGL